MLFYFTVMARKRYAIPISAREGNRILNALNLNDR